DTGLPLHVRLPPRTIEFPDAGKHYKIRGSSRSCREQRSTIRQQPQEQKSRRPVRSDSDVPPTPIAGRRSFPAPPRRLPAKQNIFAARSSRSARTSQPLFERRE